MNIISVLHVFQICIVVVMLALTCGN